MAKLNKLRAFMSTTSNLQGQKTPGMVAGGTVQNVQKSTTGNQQQENAKVQDQTSNVNKSTQGYTQVNTSNWDNNSANMKNIGANINKASSQVAQGYAGGEYATEGARHLGNSNLAAIGDLDTMNKENDANFNASTGALKGTAEYNQKANLGDVGQQSNIEQQSADLNTMLANDPGTSNVGALANLYRNYDPRFASLDSNVLQGDLQGARQNAKSNVEGSEQARAQKALNMETYLKELDRGQGRLNKQYKDTQTDLAKKNDERAALFGQYSQDFENLQTADRTNRQSAEELMKGIEELPDENVPGAASMPSTFEFGSTRGSASDRGDKQDSGAQRGQVSPRNSDGPSSDPRNKMSMSLTGSDPYDNAIAQVSTLLERGLIDKAKADELITKVEKKRKKQVQATPPAAQPQAPTSVAAPERGRARD